MAAATGLAVLLGALGADLAAVAATRSRAQTAADAAALAAAQELIAPSGGSPEDVAEDYASRHGATLVACDCATASNEVTVTVRLDARLHVVGGSRDVEASARAAVAAPAGSEGLQPFFVARLACLFARVPGLWIVSGFRTFEEQAELYEEKPDLAAPPGHSNHELGLAADLGYPTAAAQRDAHATAPGCGLHYPVSYEPWHIEPVETLAS